MASSNQLVLSVTVLLVILTPAFGFLEGIYCGEDNCYTLLGVTRDNSKNDIRQAYRKLARKWHPDRHTGKEEKAKAEVVFQKIAHAYEILKDEEQRKEYDYMLDNPEEMMMHMYTYYKRRVAPQIDIKIVLVVTISIVSAIQYWNMWNNYNTAIDYLVTVPKYRLRAKEIATSEGLLQRDKKLEKGKSKEELRLEHEAVLRGVIEKKMDIRGGYSRPKVHNILWVQLVLLPYTVSKYVYWYVRWVALFTFMRQQYGDDEKFYLIRKNLKMSQDQWEAVEEKEFDEYWAEELWEKDKFLVWKQKKDDELKAKLAESSKYKSYRRYMKAGGPGQMMFGPE